LPPLFLITEDLIGLIYFFELFLSFFDIARVAIGVIEVDPIIKTG